MSIVIEFYSNWLSWDAGRQRSKTKEFDKWITLDLCFFAVSAQLPSSGKNKMAATKESGLLKEGETVLYLLKPYDRSQ